jgi:hypothetical protein
MIKKIPYFLIGIVVFFGFFYLLSQPPKSETESITPDYSQYQNSDLVLFWSKDCSHCQNVENWLKENNLDNKLKIISKQIDDNQSTYEELLNLVKENCPNLMESNNVGVPISFDPVNKQCIQGDTTIIEFLSSKLAQ